MNDSNIYKQREANHRISLR